MTRGSRAAAQPGAGPQQRLTGPDQEAAAAQVPRLAKSGDWPAIRGLLADAFLAGDDFAAGEQDIFEPARSLVIRSGDALVAHAGAYTRELAVPGATLPAAHLALVAVAPTSRRAGLLSRLMRHQLTEIRAARQEPVAVGWASQHRIYTRFGYGLAASRLNVSADLAQLRLLEPAPPGEYRLREAEPEKAMPAIQAVYAQVWAVSPGWSSRTPSWWRRVIADPADRRYGAAALRALIAEGPAGAEGYALWRARGDWNDAGPAGTVEVQELIAGSPAAAQALWRFLLTMDLATQLRYPLAAADDPLLHLVDEPRQLRATMADGLVVRLTDLPAALAGRRYLVPIDVILEVTDPLLPDNSGTWRLRGGPAGADCERTSARPDLSLGIDALGAVYLGGTSLRTLHMAGRAQELRAGALEVASHAFSWYCQPSAPDMF